MSTQAQEIAAMLDMLPEQERNLAFEMVKRIVLAWDPDYTKLTPLEAAELREAEASGYIDSDEKIYSLGKNVHLIIELPKGFIDFKEKYPILKLFK